MKKFFIARNIPTIAQKLFEDHFRVNVYFENDVLLKEELIEVVSSYDRILSTIPETRPRGSISCRSSKNYCELCCYVKERGIQVFNLPDKGTNCTADMTLALFLSSIQRIPEGDYFVRSGKSIALMKKPPVLIKMACGGDVLPLKTKT